jgi:hypothetical protein
MAVAAERCIEYTALSTGCRALLAFLTAFGVTARFTARPGCTARRTLRGTNNLEKKPTRPPDFKTGFPLAHYACRKLGAAEVCRLLSYAPDSVPDIGNQIGVQIGGPARRFEYTGYAGPGRKLSSSSLSIRRWRAAVTRPG